MDHDEGLWQSTCGHGHVLSQNRGRNRQANERPVAAGGRESLTMAEERRTSDGRGSGPVPEGATGPEAESEEDEEETGPDCVDPDKLEEGQFDELPEGSSCAEVWEHMADKRGEGK